MAYEIPAFMLYADRLMPDNLRIENYVTHHPKCRRVDISKALELVPNAVSSALSKLAKQGKVRRVRANGDEGDWVWEPGPDEEFVPKEKIEYGIPSQKTVTEWEPMKVSDPMIEFLFGRKV